MQYTHNSRKEEFIIQPYLESYLKILPESQRKDITEFLMKNEDFRASVVSDYDFSRLLDQINEERAQLTEYLPQMDKLDSSRHNDFMSRVYGDLNYLFAESDLIERAVENISTLNAGNLSTIQGEINKLKAKVKALKLVLFESENTIGITEQFNNKATLETKTSNLYVDKDGTPIPPVIYNNSEISSEITLPTVDKKTYADIHNIEIKAAIGGVLQGELESFYIHSSDIVNAPYILPDGDVITSGAIAIVEIVLEKPIYISSIRIKNNSRTTPHIPKVYYYEDHRYYSTPKVLPNSTFDKDNSDNIVINTSPTRAKKLAIPLVQTDCEEVV